MSVENSARPGRAGQDAPGDKAGSAILPGSAVAPGCIDTTARGLPLDVRAMVDIVGGGAPVLDLHDPAHSPRTPTSSATARPTPGTSSEPPRLMSLPPQSDDSPVGERTEPVRLVEAVSPTHNQLFRQEAVDAHYGADTQALVIGDPSGSAWVGLIVLGSLVISALVVAVFAEVEITAKASGALRAPAGLRPVASVIGGSVAEILVQAGQEVEAGAVLVRLEGKPLRVTLDKRTQALSTLREQTANDQREDSTLLSRANEAIDRRQASLSARRRILQGQLGQRSARLQNVKELVRQGAATGESALDARESVDAVRASLAALASEIAALDLESTDRKRAFQEREAVRLAALEEAAAAVQEAQSLLEQVEIRSPSAGRIESLLVGANDVISGGELLAQIVPRGRPQTIVAFLPVRETSFLRVGTTGQVEVESLPVSEFGRATAQVLRISADVAKPEELQAALGDPVAGPFVRIELKLQEDAAYALMQDHLRSGDRVLVRLHRRQRRVVALLFDFVRKWVE